MGKHSRDEEETRVLQKEFDNIEKKWITGEIKITDSEGKTLTSPKTTGLYKMCYKTGKKYRRQLHKFWFVSKAGNVISLENKNHPVWLNASGSERDNQYRISKNKKNKLRRDVFLSDYTLVALVYGSRIIGKAKDLLDKKGLEAIERVAHDKEGKVIRTKNNKKKYAYEGVSCHHIDGYDKNAINQIWNCNPERLVLVTNEMHDLITNYVNNRNLKFSNVNDYEACERELQKYLDDQLRKTKRLIKLIKKEKMEDKLSVFTAYGDKHGNIEQYENFEEARKSPNYENIKLGYYYSEALRISSILEATNARGIIDFPVVFPQEDKRYKNGFKNEYKVFRFSRGRTPVEVSGYYTKEEAQKLFDTLAPVFYVSHV